MGGAAWLWITGGVVAVVVADRVVAWWPTRSRAAPARGSRPRGSGGGPLGELIALFAPSVRHLHEEQARQRHDLVLPGDADPGWDVDLETGTARILTSAGPATAPRRRRVLTEVVPGVWTATSARWSSTCTVVVSRDVDCLVVDPGVTAGEIDELAEAIRVRGWRVVAGFSTHPHWDHVLWSRSLGDVPRWATRPGATQAAEGRAVLVAEAESEAPGHDHALTARLDPLPADTTTVPWSGPEALALGHRAHCGGSAALLLPSAGVLLAGDLLSDVEVPLLDLTSADPVTDYRDALDLLETSCAEMGITVVVPGHGTVGHPGELARRLAVDRAYLDALAGGCDVDDPRLDDPEVREQHARQRAAVRP